MANIILFEDIFVVDQINPDGKKFDKACRIVARSQNCDMSMLLDINNDIYPMDVNDKFTMALASTLNYDATPDTGYYNAESSEACMPVVAVPYPKEVKIAEFVQACESIKKKKNTIVFFLEFICMAKRKTLADKYEYVMHGKLYKLSEEGSGRSITAEVYASFGGLLMCLKGDPSHVAHFELDQRVFLLIRKINK